MKDINKATYDAIIDTAYRVIDEVLGEQLGESIEIRSLEVQNGVELTFIHSPVNVYLFSKLVSGSTDIDIFESELRSTINVTPTPFLGRNDVSNNYKISSTENDLGSMRVQNRAHSNREIIGLSSDRMYITYKHPMTKKGVMMEESLSGDYFLFSVGRIYESTYNLIAVNSDFTGYIKVRSLYKTIYIDFTRYDISLSRDLIMKLMEKMADEL